MTKTLSKNGKINKLSGKQSACSSPLRTRMCLNCHVMFVYLFFALKTNAQTLRDNLGEGCQYKSYWDFNFFLTFATKFGN